MTTPVFSFDTAHEDMIHDAQLNYYGDRLATASSDRTAKIFEVSENGQKQIAELKGHKGPVWQVAWAHPRFGGILATCSYDRKVFIWKEVQPNSWSKIYEHGQHELSVNSISWAPHETGLILACGSSDGHVSILSYKGGEWESCKVFAHGMGVNAVSWHPQKLAFASAGSDNLIKLWREKDKVWDNYDTLEGHKDWVRDVAWAPLTGTWIASASQDNTVLIWTHDANDDRWTPKCIDKAGDVVWRVSWSLTGTILAVSSADNKVTLWKESLDDNAWKQLPAIDE